MIIDIPNLNKDRLAADARNLLAYAAIAVGLAQVGTFGKTIDGVIIAGGAILLAVEHRTAPAQTAARLQAKAEAQAKTVGTTTDVT